MKNIIYILLIAALAGCEIFTIGPDAPAVVPVNQESAVGSTYLFKAGLDSNNIYAVTQLLDNPDGKPMLGEDKYSYFADLERFTRVIANKPITNVITDSLSNDKIKVDLEFDYLKSITFTTERKDELWYITDYKEHHSIIFQGKPIKTSVLKCW